MYEAEEQLPQDDQSNECQEQEDNPENSKGNKIQPQQENLKYIDVFREKPVRITVKVLVPVKEHPKFNFVGKLLGPKGNTLRRLQDETLTKMAILGRGSMRDKEKEESLRSSNDPRYNHLSEDLHVEISALAPPAEAYARVSYALVEIRRYLTPDSNDDISMMQMREMEALTGEVEEGPGLGHGHGHGPGPGPSKKMMGPGGPHGSPYNSSPRSHYNYMGPPQYSQSPGPMPMPPRGPSGMGPMSPGPSMGYEGSRNRTLGILDKAGKSMQGPYGPPEPKNQGSFGYVSYDTSSYSSSGGNKYPSSNGYPGDNYHHGDNFKSPPNMDKGRFRMNPY